jgi:hypothetical protein
MPPTLSAAHHADGAGRGDASLVFDVVIRNRRVGHRFPGGTRDIQDSWLEVSVYDSSGRRVAEAGTRNESQDPTAHRFEVLLAGADGAPVLEHDTHRFRAVVADTTIGPRDAAVVRYAWSPPAALEPSPLRVVARLLHRSRSRAMQDAACRESRSALGRAFGRATHEQRGAPLDPCGRLPITEIARAERFVGPGADRLNAPLDRAPRYRRLYEHGLGLLHDVQERLDAARASLEAALDLMGADAPPFERAMVLSALARCAGRQGRVDEALDLAARAEAGAPEHPALARVRAEALARVWRFSESLPFWRAAAESTPLDDATWADLATAFGSAGDTASAFDGARRALALQPRSEPALRAQALALESVDAGAAAFAAYLAHREPDDASDLRLACQRASEWCALETLPVHTHWLRP